MRLVIIGYGYSARAVRAGLVEDLESLAVTTRNPAKARALFEQGIESLVFDGTGANSHLGAALASATHVLMCADPSGDGDPFLLHHSLEEAPALQWAGYLSTTGVYGDHGGGWVDEETPATPSSARSLARLAAEQAWQAACADHASRAACAVFRLAGIYGPERSPLDRLRNGQLQSIIKPGQVFNRIHSDDIGRVVAAAARSAASGIFNLADDEPAPPQDVAAFGARLLGLPQPQEVAYEDADLSLMGRSFYEENKRVSNTRIKAAFGPMLFPTYRQGLAALV